MEVSRHGDDGVLIGVNFSFCGLIGVGWSDVDFYLIFGGDRVGSNGVLIGLSRDWILMIVVMVAVGLSERGAVREWILKNCKIMNILLNKCGE